MSKELVKICFLSTLKSFIFCLLDSTVSDIVKFNKLSSSNQSVVTRSIFVKGCEKLTNLKKPQFDKIITNL